MCHESSQIPHDREQLLQQFRNWLAELENWESTVEGTPDATGQTDIHSFPAVGLLQLVEAFTAMRHELKLHTKNSRSLQDSLHAAIEGLNGAIQQFQSVKPQEEEAADRAVRLLVESLVDLDESLERGAKAIEATKRQIAQRAPKRLQEAFQRRFQRLSAWQRWRARWWNAQVNDLCQQQVAHLCSAELTPLTEGYRLISSRLNRILSEHHVHRIKCVGRPVDPALMTVVDLVDAPSAQPETVVEEIRPGYCWRDKVVRFAEVRAARKRS